MMGPLIRTLADGRFHSGQALGDRLGISRAAVWKQLQKLEAVGLVVESVKGRGYRLPGGLDLLCREHLAAGLEEEVRAAIADLHLHDEVVSTNACVAALADRGHGVVCLAERQIGGRGRRGRQWVSPFARNIYLSLGWTFEGGAASLEGLSLAVGVAARRALATGREGHRVALKWPNDLMFQDRKVGGVLVEMQGDPSGDCHVVIGVGVNLGMGRAEAAPVDQPWADVLEIGDFDRNGLAAALLNQLIPLVDAFPERGFAALREEWLASDLCLDRPVKLITPGATLEGVARGVAPNGAIRIEVNGEVRHYSGGEVSLRLSP